MRNMLATTATLCIFVSCATDDGDDTLDRRRPRHDAAVKVVDGPVATPDSGSGTGTGTGTVSCYRESAPSATCTLPSHCCFTNYGATHNGYCDTGKCAWGTIDCDGPEDCASGERCCARAILDGEGSTVGYRMSCSSSACGSPPLGDELCHPDGQACSNGGSCVTAFGNQRDLPRSLYVCR
jgi:hypothetical protein